MIKMILCCDLNGAIGRNNDLIFNIKEDMAFFRGKTYHNAVLMGLNTYLSLGSKPLPNRFNIVLTDKPIYVKENMATTSDLERTIDIYRKADIDLWVIGGASVYNQCLQEDLVDEVYITVVDEVVEDADTFVFLGLLKRKFNKIERIQNINEKTTIWKLSK